MLYSFLDIISIIGMTVFVFLYVTTFLGWEGPVKFIKEHTILSNVLQVFTLVGFVRFILVIFKM